MAVDSSFIRDSVIRISRIKAKLLREMPFYGIFLGYFKFSLDDSIDNVYTDGERIFFNSKFLALIDDESLMFILLHETLHMALGHYVRRNEYDPDIFDLASDIVVNSNIYHSFSDDERKITISVPDKYKEEYRDIIGTAPHTLPDGFEGYNYTVDYVYSVLKNEEEYSDSLFDDSDYLDQDIDQDDDDYTSDGNSGDSNNDDFPFCEDSIDMTSDEEYADSSEEGNNEESDDEEELEESDGYNEEDESDSSSFNKKKRRKTESRNNSGGNEGSGEESEDAEDADGNKEKSESNSSSSYKEKRKKSESRKNLEHKEESEEDESEEDKSEEESEGNSSSKKSQDNKSRTSNPMKNKNDSSSDNNSGNGKNRAKGKAQGGNERSSKGFGGKNFAKGDAIPNAQKMKGYSNRLSFKALGKTKNHTNSIREAKKKRFDDHERWKKEEVGHNLKNKYEWKKKIKTFLSVMGSGGRGLLPLGALINLELEEKNARLDWKTLLRDFLTLDEKDYSFTPPDKRYDSSPFFLPDFNPEEVRVKNILVFVDTSGSMPHVVIKEILEEIKAAISDSNCGLKGWLGFFDAAVSKPVPIDEECNIGNIDVCGGGGTSFLVVFEYIRDVFRAEIESQDEEITAILMITDGFCGYPEEKITDGIPVMWIMTTKNEAPWGKTVHFYDKDGGNNAGL